jgi:hypothetical protein
MGRKTVDGGFAPGMDAELAILAAIESRYSEELAKLERAPKPPDDKERLRQQLEAPAQDGQGAARAPASGASRADADAHALRCADKALTLACAARVDREELT